MMEVIMEQEQGKAEKKEAETETEAEAESILGLDLDLDMDCEREDLSPVQLAAQELAFSNHTRVMDLMKNWRTEKRKIASHTSNGLQMLSAKPIVPKPPPQPIVIPPRPAQQQLTTTAPGSTNSAIRFISQNGQVLSNVRPVMTKPATTTPVLLTPGTYTSNSQFSGMVRQTRPIQITTMGQQIVRPQQMTTSQAPFAIRQSGSNTLTTASGLPVQQLIFDANSGLLIMPPQQQQQQQQQQQPRQPNIMSTPIRHANVNIPARPVSVSAFRQGTPVTPTTQLRRTPGTVSANPTPYNPPTTSNVVPTVKTYQTPKIISSTSLNQGARQPTTTANANAQNRQQGPAPAAGRTGAGGQGRTLATVPAGRPVSNGGTAAAAAVATAGNSSAAAATGSGGSETDANNRTFPSLVVNVKPCLHEKPTKGKLNDARAELDARVKALLIYQPAKFTEWLMQKGLLKLEHRCNIHQGADKQSIPYKLGMYSDGNKQPFSGGYVWISECCTDKQITVFQGSIFEASIYPPGTLMKLIYHWSCQTTAANVLLWVKVTSYYLKNFYTLLRSACVAALHEFAPMMGGKAKFVEVGIITLGTTLAVQNGQKQVKVEILGVFDPSTKVVRMKVINPQNVGVTSASHSRVMQILWPLNHWVDKSSIILIDTSIEKSLLVEMGFKNVHQCKTNGPTPSSKVSTPTNVNVMNYLKHVVPKMFQNTLCVLSKSLIQQFLDELSWRELWGETASTTFDKMVEHLIAMTRWETGESLISRLNRISLNPFGEWSYSRGRTRTGIEMLPESIRGGNSDMPELSLQVPLAGTGRMNGASTSAAAAGGRGRAGNSSGAPPRLTAVSNKPPVLTPQIQYPGPSGAGGVKRKLENQTSNDPDLNRHYISEPKTMVLQNYYYAECPGRALTTIPNEFPTTLKCPLCSKSFLTNQEIIRHIFIHVQSMGVRPSSLHSFCEFCLKDVGPASSLQTHINEVHRMIDAKFPCLICQEKFNTQTYLTLHMWENHGQNEMPYRCEICDFKTSLHYDVVSHFTNEHSGIDSVLCPLCLKVLTAKTFTCMKQIVVHLQSHTIRKGKKCGQCTLTFNGDIEYRAHLGENSHQNEDPPPPDRPLIPYEVAPTAEIKMAKPPKVKRITIPTAMPPLKKIARIDNSSGSGGIGGGRRMTAAARLQLKGDGTQYQYNDLPIQFSNLKAGGSKCLECLKLTGNEDHFPGYMVCIKCRFATCCRISMVNHNATVHPNVGDIKLSSSFKVQKSELLPSKIYCSCGFATRSGNKMVRHLVKCNKTTALSELPPECDPNDPEEEEDTKDLASKLTASMPNLLGQLGLTRKFD